jgi:hypothetical protein
MSDDKLASDWESHKFAELPAQWPNIKIDSNKGVVFYIYKSQLISSLEVGTVKLFKKTEYNTHSYDCFMCISSGNIDVPANSSVKYFR